VRISLIVAMAENGVIGRAQQLPWHLPDDLKRFKALTLGKPILMGRRTYESIGRALPGRRNLVMSRSGFAPAETTLEGVASLREALERCADASELCVIGGAEVFRQALPLATHLHLTRVHAQLEGDVRFPEFDQGDWRQLACVAHAADERHAWPMSFVDFERLAVSREPRA
jgi:dihydrofolate reductase